MNNYNGNKYRLTIKHPLKHELRNIVVKTRPNHWVNSASNVIIPISIHSRFNDGVDGFFKLSALVNTVKARTRGKVTILLCEGAHINVLNLKFNNKLDTWNACYRDAKNLLMRFEKLFIGCEISFWRDFVTYNKSYDVINNEILSIIDNNYLAKEYIENDVEASYTNKFIREYPDRQAYVINAKLDILEMLVGMKIMHEKQYKAIFYPWKFQSHLKLLAPIIYPEMDFIEISIKGASSKHNGLPMIITNK
jgi:hypothetical protein